MDANSSFALFGTLILVSATALSAALILWLRPLFVRYALARPNDRSSHQVPTSQGGGVAVIVSTIVVTLLAVALLPRSGTQALPELAPVFGAAILIALVGALDDIRNLAIGPRLILQAVAVGIVLASFPADLRILPPLPLWSERMLLFVGLLWFVNLVNFMDGIDWITVAEVVPVCTGIVLIGLWGGLPSYCVLVALALAGALLGFAPFNRPVAQLFLGDVGSLPIGLLLGWLLLIVAAHGHIAAALLLPMYYLADATITLLRRMVAGERFWQAHRSHFYQRATERGYTVREVVGRIFAVNLMLVALALVTVRMRMPLLEAAAVAIGAGIVSPLLYRFAKGR